MGFLSRLRLHLLARRFRSRDFLRRRDAVVRIGQLRESRAFDFLLASLRDGSIVVLEAGIRALGQWGDPRAVPFLAQLVEHSHPNVQSALTESLRSLGNSTVQYCLEGIAAYGDRTKQRPALQILNRISWKPTNPRESAQLAMARLDLRPLVAAGPDAIGVCAAALGSGHDKSRILAAQALARIGTPAASTVLKRNLSFWDSHDVMKEIVRALNLLKWIPESTDERVAFRVTAAIAKHTKCQSRATPQFRLNEIAFEEALAEIIRTEGPVAIPSVLNALRLTQNADSRVLDAIRSIGRDAADALAKALHLDVACRLLIEMGDIRVVPGLLEALEHCKDYSSALSLLKFIKHCPQELDRTMVQRAAMLHSWEHRWARYLGDTIQVERYDCSEIRNLARQELQRRGELPPADSCSEWFITKNQGVF
jgi:HEAT repeat protein